MFCPGGSCPSLYHCNIPLEDLKVAQEAGRWVLAHGTQAHHVSQVSIISQAWTWLSHLGLLSSAG